MAEKEKVVLEELYNNVEKWLEILNSRDIQKMLELFSKTAVLFGTFSDEVLIGKEGAKKYFTEFFKLCPHASIYDNNQYPVVLSERSAALIGRYNFITNINNSKITVFKCRFTFLWYKNQNGLWEIIHLHSSQLPKPRKSNNK